MSVRLTRDTVPARLDPGYHPESVRVGVVHLGLGAFHRAHQAAVFDRLARAGHRDWGICAVAPRNAGIVADLRAQDHRYTLTAHGHTELVGAIRETRHAATERAAVLARIADPAVRLVTLTVTEPAYRAGGGVFTLLAAGLAARHRAGGPPLTVLSCDNVTDNGHRVAELVDAAVDPATRHWLADAVSFPRSVVDRIAPAPTDADREHVAATFGVDDRACVVTEPYLQWVVERGGPQPPWDEAGGTIVDDVTDHQRLKLRVLNATHSLVAYLALAQRIDTIAAALADPQLRAAAIAFQRREALPSCVVPAGVGDYPATVLDRFADPALRHTARQVAADGSAKLPQRLAGPIDTARRADRVPQFAALTLAGWLAAVTGAQPVADADGDRLRGLRRDAGGAAAFAAAALAGPAEWLAPVVGRYLTELEHAPGAAVRRALDSPTDWT